MIAQSRNYGCRITRFSIAGVEAVTMENEQLRISFLPGKGGDIFEFLHKPTDTDIMYRSQDGLRLLENPDAGCSGAGGNFWEKFVGGWFEMLPNAGNPCRHLGAPYGTHGEVMMLPWKTDILVDTPEKIQVKLSVHCLRLPLSVEKCFTLCTGSGELLVEERATNFGAVPLDFMWGHHITMGKAFLNSNCRILLPKHEAIKPEQYHTPESRLAPSCLGSLSAMPGADGRLEDLTWLPPEGSGCAETLFITFPEEAWFAVTDTQKNIAFRVDWDKDTFPVMWVWQECNATKDYPFYGDCYALALEPMSGNTPILSEAVKDGSAHTLQPKESRFATLRASISESAPV